MSTNIINPRCRCGNPSIVKTSRTPRNPNRDFFACLNGREGCGYFDWVDETIPKVQITGSKRAVVDIDFPDPGTTSVNPFTVHAPGTAPDPVLQIPVSSELAALKVELEAVKKNRDETFQKLGELVNKATKGDKQVKKFKTDANKAKLDAEKAKLDAASARREAENAKREAQTSQGLVTDLQKAVDQMSSDIESLKRFNPPGQPENPKRDVDLVSCKICYERPIGVTLFPCRHTLLCEPCAQRQVIEKKGCPICRAPICYAGKIYLCE